MSESTNGLDKNALRMAMLLDIQKPDPAVRMAAAQKAGPLGADAVAALGGLIGGDEKGIAKAARHALERIVHHAARPGAKKEADKVTIELVRLTASSRPLKVRREAVRQLQYIGDDDAAPYLAGLMRDADLREDARLSLERIPGRDATRTLERAAKIVPADFQPHLKQSLAHRKMTPKTIGIKSDGA